MSDAERQKEYFEKLIDVCDTPIYTARDRLKDKSYRPGRRQPIEKHDPAFSPVTHRTIANNEIVVDFDAKSFAQNAKYLSVIKRYLVAEKIPHYVFWTGGKGIHLHIFLNLEIKSKPGEALIKKAVAMDCNIFSEVRVSFVREIIESSGLDANTLLGKIIDVQKLRWDDLGGKSVLIRCCGGQNRKMDVVGNITGGFKTYLDKLPKKAPQTNNFSTVIYPDSIEQYDMPEIFVLEVAKRFVDGMSKLDKKRNDIIYTGKHLNLPCFQQVLEGMDLGVRSHGALIISLACKIDGKTKDETKDILKIYVKNCVQVPAPFNFSEAVGWMEWVWKSSINYWNCGLCRKYKVCDDTDCELHKNKYKKELKIFDSDAPLVVIKKALDKLIVGEDKLKMELFFILLTKEFSPDYGVVLDGPAASGKTHVIKAVCSLFGEENESGGYFVYSRMTSSSLNHAEDLALEWKNSIVLIEELQGARNVIEQLRVLITEGKLPLMITQEVIGPDGVKDFKTVTKMVETENTIFCTCNAEAFTDGDQFLSRLWILNTDSSQFQTSEIMKHYLSKFSGKNSTPYNLEPIRIALRLLERPYKILFPFADKLDDVLSSQTVRARRDVQKMILLVKACAFFHSRRRTWMVSDNNKYLIADWCDVQLVMEYAGESLSASTQGLGSKDMKNYDIIVAQRGIAGMDEFSGEDVCRWLNCSPVVSRKTMANLILGSYVVNNTRPPLKAKYELTAYVPESTILKKDFLDLAAAGLKTQEQDIDKWIKENYKNGKKR